MQTALLKIWTLVANFISYDDNINAKLPIHVICNMGKYCKLSQVFISDIQIEIICVFVFSINTIECP